MRWLSRRIPGCIRALLICGLSSTHAQSVSTSIGGLTSTPTRSSPSGVFWNPAAIGPGKGTALDTNLTLYGGWLIYDRAGIDPRTNQEFDSSEVQVLAPSPFISVATDFGLNDWKFGYSTYFPSGALANYPKDGSQRYELIHGLYIPWNHQLTVAYSPNEHWSFGAAAIYSLGFFRSEFDIDMARVLSKIMDDANVPKETESLNAPTKIPLSTAHGISGGLGVLYRPNVQWSFAISAMAPMTHVFKQRLQMQRPRGFDSLGPALASLGLEDQFNHKATFKFESPWVLNAGIRYQPYGYYTGEYYFRYLFSSKTPFASVKFVDSSLAILEDADLPGGKTDDSIALGTVQTFDLWRPIQAGVVAGYSTSGVPEQSVSPSRIGFNTFTTGIFARYRWTPKVKVSLEYAHSFIQERKIKNASNPGSNLELYEKPLGNGNYRAGMDRIGVNLAYEF